MQRCIGITGPDGFIASHLIRRIERETDCRVLRIGRHVLADSSALSDLIRQCDSIVHLAGMNRGDDEEVYASNIELTGHLIAALETCERPPHVIFASSTQRTCMNAYGRSKRKAELRLVEWANCSGGEVTILVIPNVYGPGCRPYYNSVVATFCHQLAHGESPKVLEDREIEFIWVNSLVEQICAASIEKTKGVAIRQVSGTTRMTVSQLLTKLKAFHANYFQQQIVPDLANPFDASLYTTFLSHVRLDDHRHQPEVRSDDRGRLFEVIRTAGGGQVFFSTTKPKVIRGNHYHTRKVEWFCVLQGEAAIRLRRVGEDQVCEFRVSGESPEFISIPAMHTHQIENVGNENLLTMFWCNELFEPADPDTYFEQVA